MSAADVASANLRTGNASRTAILVAIRERYARDGWPVVMREIATDTGLSLSNVKQHVDRLYEAGLVRTRPGRTGVIPA